MTPSPCRPEDLIALLAELDIEQRSHDHPPMYTVADSKAHRQTGPGGYTKNLFLRNKKGDMWLVTCQEDRELELKSLGTLLAAGRLSFASRERLMQFLGITPGAVSPFSLINDHSKAVRFAIDRTLLDCPVIHLHPLVNTITTSVSPKGLEKFLEYTGHIPVPLDFDVAHGC